MANSHALCRLLYREREDGSVARRGYHYSGSYDSLLSSAILDQPAAVQPRSGFRLSCACFGGCVLSCIFMKTQSSMRLWFTFFLMSGMYFGALKAHKVGNGLAGHQCGFFAAGLGTLSCVARLLTHTGRVRTNIRLFLTFVSLMWYEVGRYHLWSEHASEFRRNVTPQQTYNLLTEYVPPDIEADFLPYRAISPCAIRPGE
ncbi:hypothetical protein ERJ75_001609400 [Trypanosoma vivax]|uniref:Transmembrane protein n=1 Tax=Trypanosoma vivax (strain Y486) TaxID=1055687 RepID=G0TSW5_TRYVY|nr:hypothetical protein TRVL_06002 [Trypanosoma vivax]KAH8605528.1 hypothetical protein ERJ75_001609400 [Trypanosoma vivax]CCC47044.1 conserved hypothetical protein [Trypanosoma vivax Y486]